MNKKFIRRLLFTSAIAVCCAACVRVEEGSHPSVENTSADVTMTEAPTEVLTEAATSTRPSPTDSYVELTPATDRETAFLNLQKTIETYMPGVVCWGDSLTRGAGSDVGYPDVLRKFINEEILAGTGCEIPVIMMGVGGETSSTIAARAGGKPMIVTADFTIPEQCVSVQLDFLSVDGHVVETNLQGDEGVEYVEICGVRGTFEYLPDVSGASGKNLLYYFKRSEPGAAVTVPAGTVILTRGYLEYKDYLPVIFMGENGGYRDSQELISQQMSIVETGANQTRYIMIGLTTGTAADRKDLEAAMIEQYGNQFINAREILSRDGMSMMEVETTVFDKMMMDEGRVPGRLLSDSVHLNEAGYRALGVIVYERMKQLGYFDEIIAAADEYRKYLQ